MKSTRKLARLLSTVALGTMLFVACSKDNDDTTDNTYTISGNASGSQEVPSVATNATATLSGSYNADNNKLDYNITWTGLSGNVTAAHFHGPAVVGVNASPIHDITVVTNGISGTASGSITLHDTTEAHFLAGRIYYNLHTAQNPGGEVRGQISTSR